MITQWYYICYHPKGTAWVELAENGSVHVFSDENINMRATKNINVRADEYPNFRRWLGC